MAAGKKSFVIYTSWKMWLDGLSLEQKGIWLDWMLLYTNDENPDFPKDQAVMIACMMAKDTLKRDLKKYEDKVERIRAARENNPNNNKELNTNNKQTEINNDIKLKSVSNQSEISSVNVNVNVNDNVNVNEISNDIINKENTKEKVSTETAHAYGEYKRIRLKDSQYNKLVEEFGKDKTDLAITKLDEYVQSNNNKNKYKDFYIVLRKVIKDNWFNLNASEEFTSQSKREIQFEEAIPGQSKRMGKKNYTYANTDVPWEEL